MDLSATCQELRQACLDAGSWVGRNQDVVRNEEEGLRKELRRAARLFGRLGISAGRKMCAGVFGPSQAGKSYLISALARDADGALMALFGEERHDFLLEINPEGGKESTGLVTRFTVTKPEHLPADHTVQIRLLSETDLVKILANTYFADCEHKDDPQSDIEKTLNALEGRAKDPSSPMTLDSLEDLREYCFRDFRSKARVQLLEQCFWDRAIAIGPGLTLEDRVTLYGLIWDSIPEFTQLLRTLLLALEELGHPDLAFCPIEALIPRTGSIIDVATLEGLSDLPNEELLAIVAENGKKASLPRAVVTALTAELTIVMEHMPAPYFATTDLLDFPGYRSRYKIDNVRRELQKPTMLKEMFLRGKVCYLFQRYLAWRELTSMLLCIGPSNQEVQDLPGVINDWVVATHGDRPQLRDTVPVSLFLILTKFDMEFEQKKGAPSVESRWDNRLHASLLDFFGKQHDWPREWDSKGAFRNIFLLRNPNFRFDAIITYDQAGHEVGIRPEMQSYVDSLEQAFLQSPLVASHFANPRISWDAAMRLNDGGISYIRESLSPLCNPALKAAQLAQSVRELCEQLHRRLNVFYHSNDRETLLKQKLALVKIFYTRLGVLEKQYHRMGLLLTQCTVTDADIFSLYQEAYRRFLERPEEAPPKEEAPLDLAAVDISDLNIDAWNPFAEEEAQEQEKDSLEHVAAIVDEASFFADYIESTWIAKLHAIADDPAKQAFFHMSNQELTALVSELATGCVRYRLREHMLADFRKAQAYTTKKESIVWQQSCMAAHAINSFVAWLGYDPRKTSDNDRLIKVGSKTEMVFAKAGEEQPLVLSETRGNYVEQYLKDWLTALYALIVGNVNFDGERTINVEENAALGSLLTTFSKNSTLKL